MIDASNLKGAREALGFTQSALALAMGLSLRQYQEIEADASKVRELHINALMWVSLNHAAGVENPALLTSQATTAVKRLARFFVKPDPVEAPPAAPKAKTAAKPKKAAERAPDGSLTINRLGPAVEAALSSVQLKTAGGRPRKPPMHIGFDMNDKPIYRR